MNLNSSFTGDDLLSATIDIGGTGGVVAGSTGLNFDDTTDALTLDGLTYTFPVGGATVMVGDNTDISAVYTGACAYSSFTDYLGNCGTGNSVGLGNKGVTAAMSYAFDSGFSLAGGISSNQEVPATSSADAFTPGLLTKKVLTHTVLKLHTLQILTEYQLLILIRKEQLDGELAVCMPLI